MGYNHFVQVCRTRQKIDVVTEEPDTIFLGNVTGNNRETSDWYEKIVFVETGKAVSFKLDTGAGANVIAIDEYRRAGPVKQFEATGQKLVNYDGSKLKVVGKVELACEIKNQTENFLFYVVDCEKTTPLMGLPSIKKIEALDSSRERSVSKAQGGKNLISENKDLLEGIGKLGYVYDF